MKIFLQFMVDMIPTWMNFWLIYCLFKQNKNWSNAMKRWRPVAKITSYEDENKVVRVGTGAKGLPPPGTLLYVRDVEKPV